MTIGNRRATNDICLANVLGEYRGLGVSEVR